MININPSELSMENMEIDLSIINEELSPEEVSESGLELPKLEVVDKVY